LGKEAVGLGVEITCPDRRGGGVAGMPMRMVCGEAGGAPWYSKY